MKGASTRADAGRWPRNGDVLAGKLRVERVIGEGGMGVVVAATHLRLDRQVAVKLVRPERAGSSKVVQRFLREARAAVRLRSDHVTAVFDAGELDNGAPYIVMELLDGESLAELVGTRGRLPTTEAVGLLLQACIGVADAHAHGIVHRDLKPANLFVVAGRERPHVKVLDFGISKAPPDADWDLESTIEGETLGSPAYMSPEQMRSPRTVDARTDIWSLGATLFHLLAGVPPFNAESLPDLCVKVLHDPTPVLPDDLEIPAELRAVLDRCLAKDRDGRYASVVELAAALAPFAPAADRDAIEQLAHIPHGVPPQSTDATHRTDLAPRSATLPVTLAESKMLPAETDADHPARPSRRALPLAIGAIAAAAAVALSFGMLRDDAPATVEPAPATVEPASATVEPAPATVEPASATVEPAPATVEPAPALVEPKPSPTRSRSEIVRRRAPARDEAPPKPPPVERDAEAPGDGDAETPIEQPTPVSPVGPADRRH